MKIMNHLVQLFSKEKPEGFEKLNFFKMKKSNRKHFLVFPIFI